MASTDVPKLITVPQAARALRIGRSTAYDLAHAWLESRGAEGLPVVLIGRTMRVPVAGLERLFAIGGFGPAWNSGLDRRRGSSADGSTQAKDERPEPPSDVTAASRPSRSRTKSSPHASHQQLSLFDSPEA